MAEPAKDQDQSMEDILQSIKRIIAEEGDPVEPSGSDVLELTEQLAEDGSVSRVKPREEPPAPVPSMSIEEIMAAPISSLPAQEPAAVEPEPAPEPEPEVAVEPEPEPMPEPEPVSAAVEEAPALPPMQQEEEEGLISGATRSASVAALNALRDSMSAQPAQAVRQSSAVFRSGLTVEDLVVESLKPMLKEWLDGNLPGLVEAIVKKEISKLTQA